MSSGHSHVMRIEQRQIKALIDQPAYQRALISIFLNLFKASRRVDARLLSGQDLCLNAVVSGPLIVSLAMMPYVHVQLLKDGNIGCVLGLMVSSRAQPEEQYQNIKIKVSRQDKKLMRSRNVWCVGTRKPKSNGFFMDHARRRYHTIKRNEYFYPLLLLNDLATISFPIHIEPSPKNTRGQILLAACPFKSQHLYG